MSEKETVSGNINHIAEDVVFNGDIEFVDNLTVSGFLLGNIKAEKGILDITKQGNVDGVLELDSLNNKGSLSGSITTEKLNLFANSTTQASINTKEIMVERHGKLSGQISMPE